MDTININECIENNNIKDHLILNLNKDTSISIYNTNLQEINISVEDNIKVFINDYTNNSELKTSIIFTIHNNSSLVYNLSNIVKKKKDIEIKINYLGKNSKVETNIHSLVSGEENIKIIGEVKNNNKNNELLENVKVMLIDDGKCKVIPDMLIDTNTITANHKVAISNLRNDELFYLKTKGLSTNAAENLIKKSFLISNINNEKLKEKINENL